MLRHVRQARRVTESCVAHAETTRLCGHHLGKAFFRAPKIFSNRCRYVVGRFGDHGQCCIFSADTLSRTETDFRGRTRSRISGNGDTRILAHATCLHGLEQHVEGHHLGEGGRIALCIRVRGEQRLAGVRINYDGCVSVTRRYRRYCCRSCRTPRYNCKKKGGLCRSFQGICDFTKCGTHDDDLPVSRIF